MRCIVFSVALLSLVSAAHAQSASNNPYAPSPTARLVERRIATPLSAPHKVTPKSTNVSQAPAANGALTSVYKIGTGDILFVNIANTAGANGYYIVREDGTIDFPIAGDTVSVAGKTTFSAAGMIARGISIYADPQIEVKVSQYASHKVDVFGLVERSGEKAIQREAVPLFVIKAEAGVDPKATHVRIRRPGKMAGGKLRLNDPATDDVLILPGDSVEFTEG